MTEEEQRKVALAKQIAKTMYSSPVGKKELIKKASTTHMSALCEMAFDREFLVQVVSNMLSDVICINADQVDPRAMLEAVSVNAMARLEVMQSNDTIMDQIKNIRGLLNEQEIS